MARLATLCLRMAALAASVRAQQPQYPPAFPPTPILPSSINYAPSITPTIMDPTAPNAQSVCPGYTASNVQESSTGVTASLTLAGSACNAYGNDIVDLVLSVEYQSQERLAVSIYPKYLVPGNESLYLLSDTLTPQPTAEATSSKASSDLEFVWSNDPTFQFKIVRVSSGEVLFNTYGSKIVFEDQFLELVTTMVPDYNVYGLAENLRGFRIPNNFTQTFWNNYNLTDDQLLDVNSHSVHPMYLETRYSNASSSSCVVSQIGDGQVQSPTNCQSNSTNANSTSHGVYARNAHGQEWLFRSESLTYRTIGGSFEFYFLSGSTPKEVISQYQTGIVKTPVMQPYWALGFFQCRWGYQNWTSKLQLRKQRVQKRLVLIISFQIYKM